MLGRSKGVREQVRTIMGVGGSEWPDGPDPLVCFVCGGALEVLASGHTQRFLLQSMKRQKVFLVCPDCMDELVTEEVRRKRVFARPEAE
jgi:hypothetical protein